VNQLQLKMTTHLKFCRHSVATFILAQPATPTACATLRQTAASDKTA